MKDFIKTQLRTMLVVEKTEATPFTALVNDLGATIVAGKNNIFQWGMGSSKLYFKPTKRSNTIELDLIETPSEDRGNGSAKNMLAAFLSVVDKYRLNVELMVSPRDRQTDSSKLAKFYKNYGFQFAQMNGFESDFEMVRYRK